MYRRVRAFSCALIGVSGVLAADVHSTIKEDYDADLFNKDKVAYFVSGEFLYWLVGESANQYAIKMHHEPWSATLPSAASGRYHNASFDWAPGFRVHVGYFNAPHYWDLLAQYTFLSASGHNKVYAPEGEGKFLNGTWVQPDMGVSLPPVPLRSAASHLRFDYHLIDLLFARRFDANPHLRMNLFGGLTSAFIYQHWKVHYEDVHDVASTLHNHWKFEGLGLRTGIKVDWYMGCDLYLTGLVSGGILSGWYKNTARQKTSFAPAGADPALPVRHSTYEDNRLAPTAQMEFGPSWQKRFKSTRVTALAAYEFTLWGNLHEVYRSSVDLPEAAKETFVNTSPVFLQGLTVQLAVDF